MSKVFLPLSFLLAAVVLSVATPILPVPETQNDDDFQDDMILTEEQQKFVFGEFEDLDGQTGRLAETARWPSNMLNFITVPFRIRPSEEFSEFS